MHWADTLSTATYTVRNGTVTGDGSTSMASTSSKTQANMDNATRLCLGCHDGTVALDSFRGKDGGPTNKSISDYKDHAVLYNPNIGGAAALRGKRRPVRRSPRRLRGPHRTDRELLQAHRVDQGRGPSSTSPDLITSGTDINTERVGRHQLLLGFLRDLPQRAHLRCW